MIQDLSAAGSIEQARFQALGRSCLAMYVALSADLGAIAYVHAATAPWWAWAPFLALFMIPKAIFWYAMFLRDWGTLPAPADCARRIRLVGVEVVLGIAVIVVWQVWISRWATPQALLLLSLCMGGQMVFLLFGLLHLRVFSVLAACLCVAGLLAIAAGTGPDVLGILVLLGGGLAGLAYVAYEIQRDFSRLVLSRIAVEAKSAEIAALGEQNLRIANTDMLTEIGNRRSCFCDLEATLRRARADGGTVAFGIIDLDGFKSVNDSHGHLAGDRLLRAMAGRLREALADNGEVYRLSGDEFAFVVLGVDDPDGLRRLGDAVIEAVHMPLQVGELRLLVGCSVGFATFPRSAGTATELHDRADYALFHAKRTGRLKTVVFSDEHERDVREAALLERTLRAADLEAEFSLVFQPIVDSQEDRTPLLECLARWHSPVLGAVSPGRFIEAAEQSGFISTLTPVLLRKALAAIRHWPDDVGISFNLSGHDICSPERVLALVGILMASGVSPRRVEFEVTETALMMDLDAAIANLHSLKATGACISLDDFGTGYSSLSQIQKLPLDKIKVDGSFVRDLASSEASRKIVRSVNALSRDLSLSCVVEGVETREQLDILQGIGCRLIQGYFYSRPLPEADVPAFLAAQGAARRAEVA
ncbi:EAL domain-containing protein [Aureimonas flava]|uniref:EAL domain-containing protein n=1 Tax=Aureimonas flava TaxID=2320271 RepID=A0A3A1WQB3_9HYPH|nr:EAL domain-containing protein [Aureimonas flava]RIY02534.1 EAL domain-containing protein [Aureimonas flava]